MGGLMPDRDVDLRVVQEFERRLGRALWLRRHRWPDASEPGRRFIERAEEDAFKTLEELVGTCAAEGTYWRVRSAL